MRCVFDTNVLISALLLPDSKPRRALDLALRKAEVLPSFEAIAELYEVLSRKQFRRFVDEEDVRSFIASAAGFGDVRNTPDLITSKLATLQFYQRAIPAPAPPSGSFDAAAAERGKQLFHGAARCFTCHVRPKFTEPGWGMRTAQ